MKKIISLILLSVLMLMTCSCEVAPQTVTPIDTAGEVTPTATATPTAEPTQTSTPTLEDTLPHPTEYLHKQGVQYLLSTGYFDTPKIELCTNDAGKKFLSLNALISKEDSNYNENFGNSEYYTWHLAYHHADVYPQTPKDVIGYYTVNPVACEERENGYNLYRLNISNLQEGDFIKDLKKGEIYMFLITLVDKDGNAVFSYNSFELTEELAEIRDNFYASND